MACYDFACTKCGWKGTKYNVRILECDSQKCDQCGGELQRSETIAETNWVMGANGFAAINSRGQRVPGQFGGTHVQKRRFSP